MAQIRKIIAPQAESPELRSVEFTGKASKESYHAEDSKGHKALIEKVQTKNRFITIPEQIAKDNFYISNWYYEGGKELFPNELAEDMRRVSKYFPNALGKPLYVDEPRSNLQIKRAWEKHKVLKEHGYRHIVIEEEPIRTSLFDAMEQLGE